MTRSARSTWRRPLPTARTTSWSGARSATRPTRAPRLNRSRTRSPASSAVRPRERRALQRPAAARAVAPADTPDAGLDDAAGRSLSPRVPRDARTRRELSCALHDTRARLRGDAAAARTFPPRRRDPLLGHPDDPARDEPRLRVRL